MSYTSVQSVQVPVTEGASGGLHPEYIHQARAYVLTQGFTDRKKGHLKKYSAQSCDMG